jgi:hypothetical protein
MRGTFRLREAIVAVPPSSEASLTIITVPHGAVLEVVGDLQKSGLVEVLWERQRLAVFMRDLETRGEVVEVARTGQ